MPAGDRNRKVPWPSQVTDRAALDATIAAFHAEHERLYSFRLDEVPVEIVTLRVDAVGLLPALRLGEIPARGPASDAIVGRQRISLASGGVEAPVYDRARLGAGVWAESTEGTAAATTAKMARHA